MVSKLPPSLLAADLRHGATGADEAGVGDPVLQLLVANGEADVPRELLLGSTRAKRFLQVPLAPREETGPKLAVGGEADPVAGRAERLGDRIDEADLAGAVGEAEAARGRRRRRRQLDERPALLDQGPDLAAGQDAVLAPDLVGVERHELDEADDVRLAARELGESRHLLLGEALERDAVDLDRPELGVALGLLEPAQHL